MGRKKRFALALIAAGGLLSYAAGAQASVQVLGGGFAEACWRASYASALVRMDSAVDDARWKAESIALCDEALAGDPLNRRDYAATFVNRGVLEMSRAGYDRALRDFDRAIQAQPGMAEAYVNRGSVLVAQNRYREGEAEITRGIEMGTQQAEKAYYNRAMARERMDDLKGAYLDYAKAAELAPQWADPAHELTRFTLTPTGQVR